MGIQVAVFWVVMPLSDVIGWISTFRRILLPPYSSSK